MNKCIKINNELTKEKSSGSNFIMIQTFVCCIILMLSVMIKFVDIDLFNQYKKIYNNKLNEVITFGSEKRKCDDIVKSFFSNEEFCNENGFISSTSGITAPYINLSMPLYNPVDEGVITSEFGVRKDPLTGQAKHHSGLDIGCDKDTEIHSVLTGTVKVYDENDSYGKYIIIDHGNGIETLYAHCDKILSNEGDKVIRTQPIALVGSSGESTGSHLHFEFIVNDIKYNPQPLLSL